MRVNKKSNKIVFDANLMCVKVVGKKSDVVIKGWRRYKVATYRGL